jgi:hypothetical protein
VKTFYKSNLSIRTTCASKNITTVTLETRPLITFRFKQQTAVLTYENLKKNVKPKTEDITVWFTQEADRVATSHAERGRHQSSIWTWTTRGPYYIPVVCCREPPREPFHTSRLKSLTCLWKIWNLGIFSLEFKNQLNFSNTAWKTFHHKMILGREGCWRKRTAAVTTTDINWFNSHQVTSLATRLLTW